MTDNHTFTDPLGQLQKGRSTMTEAWKGYFHWMPDYSIRVNDTIVHDQTVVVFGVASGTYSVKGKLLLENGWKIPACWRAVVRNGKVSEWRIYTDNRPVHDIMAKYRKVDSDAERK